MNNYKNIDEVTLLTVTSVDVDLAKNALLISNELCKFDSVKILSPRPPTNLPASIEHIAIPPIDFLGYSKLMVEDLHKYIDTKFCLIIQADGFVINPDLWNTRFLEYDYIGAPWPPMVSLNNNLRGFSFDKNRVGNGGFSLRSKKLLETCSQIKFDQLNLPIKSEDIVICHYLYEEMLKADIKFAPLELASQFSIESQISGLNRDLKNSFGFHGKHWLSNNYLAELASKSKYKNEFLSLLRPPSTVQSNRIGRLDPCPCGSDKRYKECHGKIL
jgi:Protein of unknown function (DUF5672)/SEC-C motif